MAMAQVVRQPPLVQAFRLACRTNNQSAVRRVASRLVLASLRITLPALIPRRYAMGLNGGSLLLLAWFNDCWTACSAVHSR